MATNPTQQSLSSIWNTSSYPSQTDGTVVPQTTGSLSDAWGGQPAAGGLAAVWGSTSLNANSVPRYGGALVVESMKGGALSQREDREMLEKVKGIVSETIGQVVEVRRRIDQSIQKFIEESDSINEQFSRFAHELVGRLTRGEIVSPAEAGNVKFVAETAKNVGNRFFETSKQLMELQKLNVDGKLGDFKGVIDLVYYARTKELELLKGRLEVLQKQENHELKIMIAIQDQQLKEEAQHFDQFMTVSKFMSEEDQRHFQNGLEVRKQKHSEEMDLSRLALEGRKVEMEHTRGMASIDREKQKDRFEHEDRILEAEIQGEVQRLKEKNHKEIEVHRINADKEARLEEIDANARVQTMQAISSMATPAKCTIM